MVYAPLGRSGVYPLQSAFGQITKGMAPAEKLRLAKRVFDALPAGHPFKRNPHLVDHKQSDAGFYDLLLHSSDRSFLISEIFDALCAAGLEFAGFPEPSLYDPGDILSDARLVDGMPEGDLVQLAENLRGTFKTHTVYAVKQGARVFPPLGRPDAVPVLRGIDAGRLAQVVSTKGEIKVTSGGKEHRVSIPKAAGAAIAHINGQNDLAGIRDAVGLDPIMFNSVWRPVEAALTGRGLMHYSRVFRR